MAGEIVTVAVTAMLLVLVVAMARQRDGMAQRTHQAGSATDGWRTQTPPQLPDPRPAPPARDPEAAGRDVMQHFQRLEERAPGLAAQVLPVFIKDTEARLSALAEALNAQDSVAAHRVAHTLHGSVASVGASSMVHACAEIIRAVRLGAFDGCDRLLRDLQDDFASIRRAAAAHRI